MGINSVGQSLAIYGEPNDTPVAEEDKSILGKDDFLKLLLVELQHQDPTEPMDSEKILTQTSQLATLESSENTNNALSGLADSISNTQEFSTIAAIGKRADLGSDAIALEEGSSATFEIYYPEEIANGTIDVTDGDGRVVATIPIEMPEDVDGNVADKLAAGVYQFTWDGKTSDGVLADGGIYHINSKYADPAGNQQQTRLGAYPIESVRFEDGKALVKLGSNYVPLSQVVEVY